MKIAINRRKYNRLLVRRLEDLDLENLNQCVLRQWTGVESLKYDGVLHGVLLKGIKKK